MLCKTYKNGNITIKHEQDFDGDVCERFHLFPLWIAEHEDGFDTYRLRDFECWGNDYGAYPLEAYVNGELGLYYVTPGDFDRFARGYTVRLTRAGLVPLFTLPRFYKCSTFTDPGTGRRGTLYTLCDTPDDETRQEMSAAGCTWYVNRCQYAPEIEHAAVFVPNGTPFDFE